MSFGEENLVTPVVISHTSDKAHPTVMRIDGEKQELLVCFTKGEGEGVAYAARFNDNVLVRNLPDDEEGNPQPQEWDIFVAGTQIADYVRAQPSSITNGAVLKKLAMFILQQKGVI